MFIKKFLRQVLYVLPSFLLLVSCSIKKEKIIDTTFDKYVDRFFEEAQNRGVLIDKNDFSFSIEFGETPHAGVCTRPGNDITINEYVWNDYDELGRENLIFHEMGHCILKRPHENVLLPHGECKSIMKGTEDNRSCFKNRSNNIWRDYYLDELFDINVPLPEWYISEITTTPTVELLSFETEIGSLISKQVIDLKENQDFEIVGNFIKKDGNTWIQLSWGDFEFIFRNNSALISNKDNTIYFNDNWSTFFETDLRIVYKDDFVYYLLDGEMFHIDSRAENPFSYIQVSTNAKDFGEKINVSLKIYTIE